MLNFIIRPITPDDKGWINQFITERWGDNFVVAHDVIYYPCELAGFVAEQDNRGKIGLVTYQIAGHGCEIITLDSICSNIGVGTALINAVKTIAKKSSCMRIWLITTNDNLRALRFYQKRGFKLVAVHRHAVARSRQLKPGIPLIGNDGIPISDEIELEMNLGKKVGQL